MYDDGWHDRKHLASLERKECSMKRYRWLHHQQQEDRLSHKEITLAIRLYSLNNFLVTWITLANSLSSLSECANLVVEDESSIGSTVSGTTISVCQSCGGQLLKLVWWSSTINCSASPAGDDSVDTSSDLCCSQSDGLSICVETDDGGSLNNWDVESNCLSVIRRMVDDSRAGVRYSSTVQENCSNYNADRILGAANCAMSSWECPAVVNDRSATEVARVSVWVSEKKINKLINSLHLKSYCILGFGLHQAIE